MGITGTPTLPGSAKFSLVIPPSGTQPPCTGVNLATYTGVNIATYTGLNVVIYTRVNIATYTRDNKATYT
jgi:hypothetical protein